ncbi:unnamed protein product [Pedinophyceae sp. YPF-701]|nr:unnamed protein product [Pedinophyceae sp. YPF-701]
MTSLAPSHVALALHKLAKAGVTFAGSTVLLPEEYDAGKLDELDPDRLVLSLINKARRHRKDMDPGEVKLTHDALTAMGYSKMPSLRASMQGLIKRDGILPGSVDARAAQAPILPGHTRRGSIDDEAGQLVQELTQIVHLARRQRVDADAAAIASVCHRLARACEEGGVSVPQASAALEALSRVPWRKDDIICPLLNAVARALDGASWQDVCGLSEALSATSSSPRRSLPKGGQGAALLPSVLARMHVRARQLLHAAAQAPSEDDAAALSAPSVLRFLCTSSLTYPVGRDAGTFRAAGDLLLDTFHVWGAEHPETAAGALLSFARADYFHSELVTVIDEELARAAADRRRSEHLRAYLARPVASVELLQAYARLRFRPGVGVVDAIGAAGGLTQLSELGEHDLMKLSYALSHLRVPFARVGVSVEDLIARLDTPPPDVQWDQRWTSRLASIALSLCCSDEITPAARAGLHTIAARFAQTSQDSFCKDALVAIAKSFVLAAGMENALPAWLVQAAVAAFRRSGAVLASEAVRTAIRSGTPPEAQHPDPPRAHNLTLADGFLAPASGAAGADGHLAGGAGTAIVFNPPQKFFRNDAELTVGRTMWQVLALRRMGLWVVQINGLRCRRPEGVRDAAAEIAAVVRQSAQQAHV